MSHKSILSAVLASLLVLVTSCTSKSPADTHATRSDTTSAHEVRPHEEDAHEGEGESHAEAERVTLTPESLAASGIEVQEAGSHRLRVTLDLPGEVVPNADRVAHVVPRFSGIAREVRKGLGDDVRSGEVLAIIEGNQSLSTYAVNSLISGTVIEKHITLGEFVRDDQDIFVVADLTSVWVQVAVYARDLVRIQRGQNVLVESVGAGPSSQGRIDYVGAVVGEATRAATARVVLPNPGGRWRPGTFITAHIAVDERQVPVAVPDNAVQRFEGRDCVFVEAGDSFVARPVVLGKNDGQWVEILSGLESGERFAFRGSFVLKSELQKSEASHDH